jgi:hypothetical protein
VKAKVRIKIISKTFQQDCFKNMNTSVVTGDETWVKSEPSKQNKAKQSKAKKMGRGGGKNVNTKAKKIG